MFEHDAFEQLRGLSGAGSDAVKQAPTSDDETWASPAEATPRNAPHYAHFRKHGFVHGMFTPEFPVQRELPAVTCRQKLTLQRARTTAFYRLATILTKNKPVRRAENKDLLQFLE